MLDKLLPLEYVKFYRRPISSRKVLSKQMTIYPFRIAFSITPTLRVLPWVSNKEVWQSWNVRYILYIPTHSWYQP